MSLVCQIAYTWGKRAYNENEYGIWNEILVPSPEKGRLHFWPTLRSHEPVRDGCRYFRDNMRKQLGR
jgi:hypothetical protein